MSKRRYWGDERGQSVLEAALVLPFLLLLVAGIVDFGGAFNQYIMVTNAAREGARYGSKFPYHERGILDATQQEATNFGVFLTDGDITITPSPSTPASSGEPIRVTVTHVYNTLMGSFVGTNTITISASTEMIVFGVDE